MAVSELLLQSVGDTVRVFPAWPKDKPAQFHNLRAQGGFLVSAVMADGGVERVTVEGATRLSLSISNPGPALAFFVQLRATDPEGADVLPATWSDNYISLMPGERISATFESTFFPFFS